MSFRFKFSVFLAALGAIMAFLPATLNNRFRINPGQLNQMATDMNSYFSVDQVARFLHNEDSTIRLIDVRSPAEFRSCNIPGSVNIPVGQLSDRGWESYLNGTKIKTILYSNGDLLSAVAWTVASGLGYQNIFIMKGGLNEWFNTVMNSRFTGERITARENALFENRSNARKLFIEFNSLPDSLKAQLFAMKQAERKKLDGGCE